MRLIDADEIKKREHDVILGNGAKHRCFDTTCLDEIPTVEAIPVSEFHDVEKERDYWKEKAHSYEQSILRLSICLAPVCKDGERE